MRWFTRKSNTRKSNTRKSNTRKSNTRKSNTRKSNTRNVKGKQFVKKLLKEFKNYESLDVNIEKNKI